MHSTLPIIVASLLVHQIIEVSPSKLFSRNDESSSNKEYNKNIENLWQNYKTSYEDALATSLRETFGRFPVQVYKYDLDNHLLMTRGYHMRDNNLFLSNFRMSSLPLLKTVYVNLEPAAMYLDLEAVLDRIIMLADYNIFFLNEPKPKRRVLYLNKKPSLFSAVKIPQQGYMSIIAENCVLSGQAMVVINGPTFSLRHQNIGLKNCEFTVEVPGHSDAPIIERFFTDKWGIRLQLFMNNPIKEELKTQLQGALISLFNLTEPLQSREKEFREKQQQEIVSAQKNFDSIINIIISNEKHMKHGLYFKQSLNIYLNFNATTEYKIHMKIPKDVKVLGLNTLYSTHTGGKIKNEYIEKVGYSTLLVIGDFSLTNLPGFKKGHQKFSVEIKDLTADVVLGENYTRVQVNFWKIMEIAMPGATFKEYSPMIQNVLIGHLYAMLPELIEKQLKQEFNRIQQIDETYITKTTFDICKTTTDKTTTDKNTKTKINSSEYESN